jgi:hypothetical protein
MSTHLLQSCLRARTCAALLLLLGGPLLAQDTTPPQFTIAPVFHNPPVRACPLTATITFTTDEPTKAELGFRTAEAGWNVIAESGFTLDHTTLVLGMRPATQHEIRLKVRDAAGNLTEWPIRFYHTTPVLPSSFPPLTTTIAQQASMEPGLTLIPARYSSSTLAGQGTFVILLDSRGFVVWYYATRQGLRDAVRLRNGNILCLNSVRDAFEVDMLGQIVQRWWTSNLGLTGAPFNSTLVPIDTMHHELSELPAGELGDFITLSSSHRQYPNYPISEIDPTQTTPVGDVAGDVIVEFKRDGTVVRSFDVIDALDPYRMCYNSLAPIYGSMYGVTVADWGHSNSVVLDPSDDTWLISLRNQDAVIKIRRSDHSVVWIHGHPDRWNPPWSQYLLTPIGAGFLWQFHQHAPVIDSNGNMSLFDNGNYRVIPPTPAPPSSAWFSRGMTYHVNPIAHTTQETWIWDGGGTPFLSGSLGTAWVLPQTQNRLLTEGNMIVPGMNKSFSRVQEVSGTMPSTLRFEVIVNDPNAANPNAYNWNVYRSRRVSSVYPHL